MTIVVMLWVVGYTQNLHSKSESWVANESVCMEVLGV